MDGDERIERIAQEDPNGCCVAVLAMLSRRTYQAVRSDFRERDWAESGVSVTDMWGWLWDHGYYLRVKYKADAGEDWPAPPFGPEHFAQVQHENGVSHAVYMDADGTVLDPLFEDKSSLTDYPVVNQVVAVIGRRR